MPFGLDLKSIIVGIVLALYVYPLVLGFVTKPKAQASA